MKLKKFWKWIRTEFIIRSGLYDYSIHHAYASQDYSLVEILQNYMDFGVWPDKPSDNPHIVPDQPWPKPLKDKLEPKEAVNV